MCVCVCGVGERERGQLSRRGGGGATDFYEKLRVREKKWLGRKKHRHAGRSLHSIPAFSVKRRS